MVILQALIKESTIDADGRYRPGRMGQTRKEAKGRGHSRGFHVSLLLARVCEHVSGLTTIFHECPLRPKGSESQLIDWETSSYQTKAMLLQPCCLKWHQETPTSDDRHIGQLAGNPDLQ